MIEIDGIPYRTECEWALKRRAVLKRQRDKGEYREWYTPHGYVSAIWYREDQTRPYNRRELTHARYVARVKRAEAEARREQKQYAGIYHTAWQWLAEYHRAPITGSVPDPISKRFYDEEYEDWTDGPEWFYYDGSQTVPVDDALYDRLKALYIEKFGGWKKIDLAHTAYDGSAWWTRDDGIVIKLPKAKKGGGL